MVAVYPMWATLFAPYSESFETVTFPGVDYDVDNINGNTWAQTSNAASSGTKSIYINNFGGNTASDVFITPSYSFFNVSAVSVRFKLAFQRRNTASTDQLQAFSSTNCGSNWVARYNKTEARRLIFLFYKIHINKLE